MGVRQIDENELQELLARANNRARGKWKDVINQVLETGKPLHVTEITTGQMGALVRALRNAKKNNPELSWKVLSWRDGEIVIYLEK